ncbi:Protein kinase-like domain [Pseudocohnilembus persalinus]|uniref:Protein kinase-like domain n=1 Tax=Pseudocohnilembus persalinus TaxID=266149 RepID=A0A0V0Q8Z3_PSEPJ|nr:Protein kinase-like domain [Pseudocohnilembus persalinus]|eukprot:KRW98634.1 Protein kinase-like domain [Pseudocohnilembus persalinus]
MNIILLYIKQNIFLNFKYINNFQFLIFLNLPYFIFIQKSLIENQKMMGYVTEEFETTLQIAMKENKQVCESLLELKLNFISLLQILNFLHYTLKLGHFNLSPSNIYIMPDGSWKIGGFQFSSQILVILKQTLIYISQRKLDINLKYRSFLKTNSKSQLFCP